MAFLAFELRATRADVVKISSTKIKGELVNFDFLPSDFL